MKHPYSLRLKDNRSALLQGMKDGLPIGAGYLAVSFSLGVAARGAGLSAFQGFLASLLNNASAGEYVAFALIAAHASYWEVALATLVANARYLLMSCALSQKAGPELSLLHRFLVAFDITDEIFGITIARPGPLNPVYTYGAVIVAAPCWALGTAAGVVAGNILSARLVSALSVALFGMFLAVIIPPARKDRVIAGLVLVCFAASFVASRLQFLAGVADGTRTILLTIVLASLAAILFPRTPEEQPEQPGEVQG